MKSEKIAPVLLSAILAFLLSLGAVGCLITGFRLEPKDFRQLVLLWAGASALFSLLFSRRWGVVLAACLLALAAGYLWHRGTPLEQTRNLLVYISKFYHGAYQWGYFLFGDGTGPFDYPLAVLGSLIAMANAHALVRQRSVILPLTLASLPLAACLVVTDTVPEAAYLLAFLAAFLLILLPQRLRREDPVQGCRLTLLAAVPVALALAALFTLYPKEDYVNRSKELQSRMMTLIEELPQKARDQAASLSSGLPSDSEESLDLKRLGPRPNYSYEVMTVTVPESGIFYLRGRDYDAYTGTGWTASPHRAENFGGEGQTVGTVKIRTHTKKELLFLPYYPSQAQILAGGSLKNGEDSKEYAFDYALPPEPREETGAQHIELTELEISQFGSTADRLRYLTLPGQTKVKAEALLETLLPEGADRRTQAEAIADFVRSSAEYDLNTARMPEAETDFALWFLESSDTGYCVHFASAAVVLLRAADIPARYVTGYLAHSRAGEETVVTAGNAHAWAEYYDPARECWMVLEVTPAREETIPIPTDSPQMPETAAPTPVPGEASPTVPIPGPGIPEETRTPTAAAPQASRGSLLPFLLLPLLAVAAVILQWKLRLAYRQRRLESSGPNEKALLLWQQAALLCRLLRQSPPEELHCLAQKAKYSPHTLTEEELHQFHTHITQSQNALKARAWYLQIVYRLVYAVY